MTTVFRQNYYRPLPERGGKNLYELWENGIPFGDSITPSGFVPEYVARIIKLASGSSEEGSRIVSLGSGNGFVEALLHEIGYEVLCVDHNQDAVEITTKKGLPSLHADYYDLPANLFVNTSLIYADGFFGHLYENGGGLRRAVNHLGSMSLDSNTRLLVSNDAPLQQDLEVQPHASVPDFWYMSPEFLGAQFGRVGFEVMNLETFTYHRPVSGARNRSIYQGIACSR